MGKVGSASERSELCEVGGKSEVNGGVVGAECLDAAEQDREGAAFSATASMSPSQSCASSSSQDSAFRLASAESCACTPRPAARGEPQAAADGGRRRSASAERPLGQSAPLASRRRRAASEGPSFAGSSAGSSAGISAGSSAGSSAPRSAGDLVASPLGARAEPSSPSSERESLQASGECTDSRMRQRSWTSESLEWREGGQEFLGSNPRLPPLVNSGVSRGEGPIGGEESPSLSFTPASAWSVPASAADSGVSLEGPEGTTAAPTPELPSQRADQSPGHEIDDHHHFLRFPHRQQRCAQPDKGEEHKGESPLSADAQRDRRRKATTPSPMAEQQRPPLSRLHDEASELEVFSLDEENQLLTEFELWRRHFQQPKKPQPAGGGAEILAKPLVRPSPPDSSGVFAEALRAHSEFEIQQEAQFQILQSRAAEEGPSAEPTEEELNFLKSLRRQAATEGAQKSAGAVDFETAAETETVVVLDLGQGRSEEPRPFDKKTQDTASGEGRLSRLVDFLRQIENNCVSLSCKVKTCAWLSLLSPKPPKTLKKEEKQTALAASNEAEEELLRNFYELAFDDRLLLSRLAFSSAAFFAVGHLLAETHRRRKSQHLETLTSTAALQTPASEEAQRQAMHRLYTGSAKLDDALLLLRASGEGSCFLKDADFAVQDAVSLALEATLCLSESRFEAARQKFALLRNFLQNPDDEEEGDAAVSPKSSVSAQESSRSRPRVVLLRSLSAALPSSLLCLEDAAAVRRLSAVAPSDEICFLFFQQNPSRRSADCAEKKPEECLRILALYRWFAAKTLARFALAREEWICAERLLRRALTAAGLSQQGRLLEGRFFSPESGGPPLPPDDSLFALYAHLLLQQRREGAAVVALQLALFTACSYTPPDASGERPGDAAARALRDCLLRRPEKAEEEAFAALSAVAGGASRRDAAAEPSLIAALEALVPSVFSRSPSAACLCGCASQSARWRCLQTEVLVWWAQRLLPEAKREPDSAVASRQKKVQALLADAQSTLDWLLSQRAAPLAAETRGGALGLRSVARILEMEIEIGETDDAPPAEAQQGLLEGRTAQRRKLLLNDALLDARASVEEFADAQSRTRLAAALLFSGEPLEALSQAAAALEEKQSAYTPHIAGSAAAYAALAAEILSLQLGEHLEGAAKSVLRRRERETLERKKQTALSSSPRSKRAALEVAAFALERLVESALAAAADLHPQLRAAVGSGFVASAKSHSLSADTHTTASADFRGLVALPLTRSAAQTLKRLYTQLDATLLPLRAEQAAAATASARLAAHRGGKGEASSSHLRARFARAVSSLVRSARAALAAVAACEGVVGGRLGISAAGAAAAARKSPSNGKREMQRLSHSPTAAPPADPQIVQTFLLPSRVAPLPSANPQPRAEYFAATGRREGAAAAATLSLPCVLPEGTRLPTAASPGRGMPPASAQKTFGPGISALRLRRGSPQRLGASLCEKQLSAQTPAEPQAARGKGPSPSSPTNASSEQRCELRRSAEAFPEATGQQRKGQLVCKSVEDDFVFTRTPRCGPTLLERRSLESSPQKASSLVAHDQHAAEAGKTAAEHKTSSSTDVNGGDSPERLSSEMREMGMRQQPCRPKEGRKLRGRQRGAAEAASLQQRCQQQQPHHHQQQQQPSSYQVPLVPHRLPLPQNLLFKKQSFAGLPHRPLPAVCSKGPACLAFVPLATTAAPPPPPAVLPNALAAAPSPLLLPASPPRFAGSRGGGMQAGSAATTHHRPEAPARQQQRLATPASASGAAQWSRPSRAFTEGLPVHARCPYTALREGGSGGVCGGRFAAAVSAEPGLSGASLASAGLRPGRSSAGVGFPSFSAGSLAPPPSAAGGLALFESQRQEALFLGQLLQGISPQPTVFSPSQLRCLYEIGRGGFSSVWVGELLALGPGGETRCEVALKFMRLCLDGRALNAQRLAVRNCGSSTTRPPGPALFSRLPFDAVSFQEVRQEVALLSALRSPHFVKMFGVALAAPPLQEGPCVPDNQPYVHLVLVMELCGGGSLYSLLHEEPPPGPGFAAGVDGSLNLNLNLKKRLSFARRVQLAIEVTAALSFLHNHNPPILHRDVKSLNVVLTSSGEAKLCDLGMASLAAIQQVGVFPQPWNSNPPSQGVQTEPPKLPPAGSPRYMPPEVTAGEATRLHTSQDVWSLGCLLVEIFGGPLPYHLCETYEDIFEKHRSRQLPEFPRGCHPRVARLLLACLDFDPLRRPTAAQVYMELQVLASLVHS